jgi:hypothetical protein
MFGKFGMELSMTAVAHGYFANELTVCFGEEKLR